MLLVNTWSPLLALLRGTTPHTAVIRDTSSTPTPTPTPKLSVLKARYQLETTAEIGILQRLVLPLNRIEASSWCLNERLTQVLQY